MNITVVVIALSIALWFSFLYLCRISAGTMRIILKENLPRSEAERRFKIFATLELFIVYTLIVLATKLL